MPIPFRCPYCGRQTMIDDQYAGQSGPCADCGQIIIVPAGSGESFGDDASMRALIPVGRPLSAIAAGYLGLISVAIWPLGPIALICGIIGYRKIKSDPHQHGMGRVWTGFILGGLSTLVLLFGIVALAVNLIDKL